MRIKVHNSMGKIDIFSRTVYLLDEQVSIFVCKDKISLTYRIFDFFYFLRFSPDTKEFEEDTGFGISYPVTNSGWWRESEYGWKEVSE